MSSSRNIQYERRWCSYNTERFRIKSPRGTIRRLQNYYFNSRFLFLFFLFYIYYVLRTNSPTERNDDRSFGTTSTRCHNNNNIVRVA